MFQKRSPYVNEFNKHIRLMIEMGLIKKWMESSLGQADKCSNLAKILKSHERKEVVLNLRETGTFFFMALCGTVATMLLFGSEKAMGKHKRKQREKDAHYQLNMNQVPNPPMGVPNVTH